MTERKKRPMTIERAMEKLRKLDETEAVQREAAIRRATDSLAARFNAKRNGVLNQLSPVERDAVTAASAAIKAALS